MSLFLAMGLNAAVLGGCAAGDQAKVLYSNDASQQTQLRWIPVQDGLAYADTIAALDDGSSREFFVVKVDPHLFEFKIYNNTDQSSAKSLKEIHDEQGSVLTFNGAFFDTKFKAMGLLQDSSSTYHKLIQSELMDGVFEVANNVPANGTQESDTQQNTQAAGPAGAQLAQLFQLKDAPKDPTAFMIQNGPALIDPAGNNLMQKDTEKGAGRTALGIDQNSNVILVVLHQTLVNSDNALSLYQFAHVLKTNPLFAPLGLHSVINLDGGPSTGLVVGGEYLPEMNNVQNAVIVVPRTQPL